MFAFILSVTDENAMLAYKHFCKDKEVDGMLGFRKLLAEALVCSNPYYKEEEESPRRSSRLTKNSDYRVFRLPKGNTFFGSEIVDADSFPTPKVHVKTAKEILGHVVYAPWVSIVVLTVVYIIPWKQD